MDRRTWRIELQTWLMLSHFKSSREIEVLDLGAEHGHTGRAVRSAFPNARVVGVDVHAPTLEACRRSENGAAYTELVLAGAIEFLGRGQHFDVIVAAEIVEHLEKPDGVRLLDLARRFSRLLVVTAPIGFEPREAIDGNPYQRHVSGWTPTDMEGAGLSTFALLHPREHVSACGFGVYYRSKD